MEKSLKGKELGVGITQQKNRKIKVIPMEWIRVLM